MAEAAGVAASLPRVISFRPDQQAGKRFALVKSIASSVVQREDIFLQIAAPRSSRSRIERYAKQDAKPSGRGLL